MNKGTNFYTIYNLDIDGCYFHRICDQHVGEFEACMDKHKRRRIQGKSTIEDNESNCDMCSHNANERTRA